MKIIRSPERLFKYIKRIKAKGSSVGFVPTMGALHPGHLSLIQAARKENATVVVSIFVNPAQFGPREDLKKYPRPIKKDLSLCRKEKVDFVFCPRNPDMYNQGFSTYISVEGLSDRLCGKDRPGHFRGVATVVAKLLNIVQPDSAYFGQKDAQQSIIIKRMVRDLHMPVKIKVTPTLRQADGLALSSRNIYLSRKEKQDALVLPGALDLAKVLIGSGVKYTPRIISRMRELIARKKNARVDYIAIVEPTGLKPLKKISGDYLVALAVKIGKTRLIDNFQGRA